MRDENFGWISWNKHSMLIKLFMKGVESMARLCIFLINLYRRYISRYTKPTCRFSPTCSSYALESYKRFGFFLGTYLTVKRLLKCHPFYKGEYFDNVPLFKRDIFKFTRKK